MKITRKEKPTYEKIWELFEETDRQRKETDLQFKETDRKIQENHRLFEEELKSTVKELTAGSLELKNKIKELANLFTGQWGKLVEALLAPGCIKMFRGIGIKVDQAAANVNVKRGGKEAEVDVLLVNNTELVAIEVKTTAYPTHLDRIFDVLNDFTFYFPQYKGYKIYGAIAALRFEDDCDKLAEKLGLYVIKAKDEGLMQIANKSAFVPKDHSAK